jgi:hypothetical protein
MISNDNPSFHKSISFSTIKYFLIDFDKDLKITLSKSINVTNNHAEIGLRIDESSPRHVMKKYFKGKTTDQGFSRSLDIGLMNPDQSLL